MIAINGALKAFSRSHASDSTIADHGQAPPGTRATVGLSGSPGARVRILRAQVVQIGATNRNPNAAGEHLSARPRSPEYPVLT